MPLKVKFSEKEEEKEKEFSDPRYEAENKCFLLKNSDEDSDMEIGISYKLDFPDDFLPRDYQVFLFAGKDPHENDIFQVFEKSIGNRIGWLFPLQALQSREHAYASNKHFLRYAAVAFHLICKGIENVYYKIPEYNTAEIYEISDFYHERTVIICICKRQIPNYEDFSIDNYLPSIFKQGYFLQVKRDPGDITLKIENDRDESTKKIQITETAPALKNKPYLKALLSEVLPYENRNLLNFFFLYQVIEMLMEEIRIITINKNVEKIIENKEDSYKCKDILYEINQSYRETSILNRLKENHLKGIDNTLLQNLGNACKELLIKNKKKTGQTFCENLYHVRNLLFHQYRDIEQGDKDKDIDEIIKHFRLVIAEMLLFYNP
ncbi:MAG: hypothetical protein MUF15_00265 [Acidobacteria bacterium]|jgi:hypothetical protein|nr:hypothetical protein [Acidobacteriota bacterium]